MEWSFVWAVCQCALGFLSLEPLDFFFIHYCVEFCSTWSKVEWSVVKWSEVQQLSSPLSPSPSVFRAGAHTHSPQQRSASRVTPEEESILRPARIPNLCVPPFLGERRTRAQCLETPARISRRRRAPPALRLSASGGGGTRCPGCIFCGDCEVEKGKRSSQEPCGERKRPSVGAPEAHSDNKEGYRIFCYLLI